MNVSQQTETGIAMVARAAPPVAVVSANIAGMNIADWVQVVTLVYVVIMLCHKLWTMWKEWRDDPTAPGKGWGK